MQLSGRRGCREGWGIPQEGLELRSTRDILDIIGVGMEADGLVLMAEGLPQTFFELCTGFAGELFQMVNYRTRSVLVLPDPNAYGQRFSEMAFEQQKHPHIGFVRTLDEAWAWLEGLNGVQPAPCRTGC